MSKDIHETLKLLVEIARGDTGQCVKIRRFLLAWWNAEEQGGFDLTDLWALDEDLRQALVRVFAFVAENQVYPTELGLGEEFRRLCEIHARSRELSDAV